MLSPMMRRTVVLAALVSLLAACVTSRAPVQQRTTQGPTAETFWTAAILVQNGRAPTFEEKRHWEDDIDARIAAYLRTHQEAANSLTAASFRFHKQVVVGMDKEQVRILLGEPVRASTDPAEMQNVARSYWPSIRGKASEVLVYPLGWAFFFERDKLIDITQYVPSGT
jgi:hypothetical protein